MLIKKWSYLGVCAPCFESVKSAFQITFVHGSCTWKDAGPLQVKYLVNAEKFKRNLQSDLLILLTERVPLWVNNV